MNQINAKVAFVILNQSMTSRQPTGEWKTISVNHTTSGTLHTYPHIQPNFLSGWQKLVVVDLAA